MTKLYDREEWEYLAALFRTQGDSHVSRENVPEYLAHQMVRATRANDARSTVNIGRALHAIGAGDWNKARQYATALLAE